MQANSLFLGSSGGHRIERSLRFRSSASSYLSRTPAVIGDRKKWTWSGWVKRGVLGSEQHLFTSYIDSSNRTHLRFDAGDTLSFISYRGGSTDFALITAAVFRDPCSHLHI